MLVRILACCALVVLVLPAGCHNEREIVFAPTDPVVEWGDLVPEKSGVAVDSYRLYTSGRTTGVFPTSVAVARVCAVPDGSGNGYALALDMTPAVDFLAWNSVFDDFRSVGEVFPLNQMALDGEVASIPSLLDASQELGAGMLLLYTEIKQTIHQSELRGCLYEVDTGRPLACLHASAFIDEPIPPDETKRYYESYDDNDIRDARLASIRAFEFRTRECIIALMDNDEPGERMSPEGWIPDRPIENLIWPPSEDLLLRRERH